jgi:hypothetical protein
MEEVRKYKESRDEFFGPMQEKLRSLAQAIDPKEIYNNIKLIGGSKRYANKHGRQVYIPVGSDGSEKIFIGASVSPRSYMFDFPRLLKGEKATMLTWIDPTDLDDKKREELKSNSVQMLDKLQKMIADVQKNQPVV